MCARELRRAGVPLGAGQVGELSAAAMYGVDMPGASLVLEMMRAPGPGEGPAGAGWERVWSLGVEELAGMAAPHDGGWVELHAEVEGLGVGRKARLRWRQDGPCCLSWAMTNVSTHYRYSH